MIQVFKKLSLLTFFIFTWLISKEQAPTLYLSDSIIKITASKTSIEQLNKEYNKAIAKKDSAAIATILYYKAKIYEQESKFDKAFTTYFESINLSNKINNKQIEGLCHIGLSNIDFRIGNNEQALFKGIKAAKLFNSIYDTTNYIHALIVVGQVYIGLDKLDNALNTYSEAMDLAKKTNDSLKLANTYDHMGVINTFKKNYDKALSLHKNSLIINQRINERVNLGINYANIGEIHMLQGNYKTALNELFKALEIHESENFTSCMIFTNYIIGETYSRMNKNKDAIKHFNLSLKLIDDTGEIREKPIVYKYISNHYERNNQINNALKYFKLYSRINDSLTNQNTIFKVDELRIKYDVDKKEQAIQTLALEKKARENELNVTQKAMKLQLLLLIIIIVGLVSSIAFTVYFVRSKKQLNAANNTKNLLFSIIGHDLRGPMGNIKHLSETLQQKYANGDDALFSMLQDQAESSFNLLEDLLSWSRALNENLTYNPGLVYVCEPLNKVLSFLNPSISNKNISITNKITQNLIAHADLNHLSTIFRNLISNAIKFTPQNGSITITASNHSNNQITISIQDSGIGIEDHIIEKLLKKNSHFSSYGTNNEKGSGLGLKICLYFIKKNGGRLSISSQVGKGSTFSFTLPIPKSLPN